MSVTIPIRAIGLTPGSMISIHNLSWQDFEQLLAELGEQRNTCIAYYRGTLEIMSPLALHVSEITEMIPPLVQKAIDEGTSRMLRELKIQLDE